MEKAKLTITHNHKEIEVEVHYKYTPANSQWSLYEPPDNSMIDVYHIYYMDNDILEDISIKAYDYIETELYQRNE